MNTNVRYLFDPSKYEKVKTPDQKEFENTNLELMFAMEEAVLQAHQHYDTKIRKLFPNGEMDKMLAPVSMISFIRQYFIQKYPMYCRAATPQRFRLITNNGEYIYLKKLNRKKRPSNIETHTNNLILHQVTENKNDKRPNVFFGYTRTKNYTRITGIYAVCLKGKELLWATNISDLRDSQGGAIVPLTTPTVPVLKPDVVKLKTKKDADKRE